MTGQNKFYGVSLFGVVLLTLSGCSSSRLETKNGFPAFQLPPEVWEATAKDRAAKQTVSPEDGKASSATPAGAPVKKGDLVKVKIETSLGIIEADLFKKEVPRTVENFVTLAKKGFYDGIIFHRVIPEFMIQTGDPRGDGTGDAGYKFNDEFSPNLRHDKPGVLSMANAGPNTNGSQFFITEVPTPHLNNRHSVFGQVTSGMDVVRQIARVARDGRDRPKQKVAMIKVTILEA